MEQLSKFWYIGSRVRTDIGNESEMAALIVNSSPSMHLDCIVRKRVYRTLSPCTYLTVVATPSMILELLTRTSHHRLCTPMQCPTVCRSPPHPQPNLSSSLTPYSHPSHSNQPFPDSSWRYGLASHSCNISLWFSLGI